MPPARLVRPSRLKLYALLVLVLMLILDLWSKSYMQDLLGMVRGQNQAGREPIDLIPGFLAFEGTWNPGVTFGLAPNRTPLILVLTTAATVLLLIWFLATRSRSRCLHFGLGLILSGALGNLYDRSQFSRVRDFILVYWGDLLSPDRWTWPNFNVADSCIVVGVGLVMWDALFGFGVREAKRKALARRAQPKSEP